MSGCQAYYYVLQHKPPDKSVDHAGMLAPTVIAMTPGLVTVMHVLATSE